MLQIIQFQIVKVVDEHEYFGLGLDGIIYVYDFKENHWTPVTRKRVNPLHKQSKKQKITVTDDEEGHKS
jgi:hypothetical protein